MSVRMRFRCGRCGALPGAQTQLALEGQLRDRTVGVYLDAQPGAWLVWTAGGPFGPKRYACPRHAEDLKDHLRTHYGAAHPCVWASPPHAVVRPATERAESARTKPETGVAGGLATRHPCRP